MATTPGVAVVLGAGALSVAGDSAAMVALVLRAHADSGGAASVAALLLCFALPVVATTGAAGALADRSEPRRLLLAAGLVQAAAAAGLAVVDGLAATCLLVLVMQTGFAVGQPVWGAVGPALVGEERVGRLVSLQHALRGVAGPAGAGLGGVLVQSAGSGAVLALDAVSFLTLALAGASLSVPRPDPPARRLRGWDAVLPRAGVAALRGHPVLWVLVLALFPVVVAVESVNAAEVFLVRDVLGASAAAYGLAEAVHGGAAVVGALAAGTVTRPGLRVRAVLAAVVVVALAQVGQGLAPAYAAYLAGAAVSGAALGVVNALLFALLLSEVGAARRGSVVAFVSGVSRGCSVLALTLGGVLTALSGPRTAYLVAGSAGLLVAAAAVWRVHRSVDTRSTVRG
ncbi:MFS transporter [Phycicoccus sp. M110.8]|uniref:MFS transporter n=1 Tax=Phycicoccus sp. M110.8 TaxID=3075433 RepID=UPI0028FDC175|nr:MFS transporter [Phycicoccus sp. M110.8]MDU0313501.1 MFS transporter [Phycicoccus sp. M110.8]